MATSNRRVAAYLPPEIDEAFIAFKIQHGLATESEPNQNDSQGLIQVLSEFLGVSRDLGYSVSYSVDAVTQDQLDSLRSELVSQIGELSSELQLVKAKLEISIQEIESLDNKEMSVDVSLAQEVLPDWKSNKDMATEIGVSPSTLSNWKKEKSLKELADEIQSRISDGSRWESDPETKGFIKVGSTPGISQGSLLNS